MTWTSPRTWNPGEVVTAALLNEQLRDNLQSLYDARTMGARVYRTINQSLPTATESVISFTNVLYDPQGLFDFGTATRLTAILSGVYLISGHVEFENVSALARVSLQVNGTTIIASHSHPSGAGQRFSISTLYRLEPTDYVQLLAYHERGSNMSVEPRVRYSPELAMQWVGSA